MIDLISSLVAFAVTGYLVCACMFSLLLSVLMLEHTVYIQGGPKKTAPNFSCNNFGKYGPILITFSLLHSQMN